MPPKVFTIEKDGEQIAVFIDEGDRDFCIEALRQQAENEREDEDEAEEVPEFIPSEEWAS